MFFASVWTWWLTCIFISTLLSFHQCVFNCSNLLYCTLVLILSSVGILSFSRLMLVRHTRVSIFVLWSGVDHWEHGMQVRRWLCWQVPKFGLCLTVSQPCDSAEPWTPIEALPQSSRPFVTPPPCYSLLHSAERWAFPLIVTMFPFTSGFYFFCSILITYCTLFPL